VGDCVQVCEGEDKYGGGMDGWIDEWMGGWVHCISAISLCLSQPPPSSLTHTAPLFPPPRTYTHTHHTKPITGNVWWGK
jgi:hypothetical protein